MDQLHELGERMVLRTQATCEIKPTMEPLCISDAEWRGRLGEVILQEPLIETRPSLAALKHLPAGRSPAAVFVGIGLGTPTRLSEVLPLDTLGVLLPAERVRRAVGASELVVLVADSHTLTNGFDRCLVDAQALQVFQNLETIRGALRLDRMRIIRASDFHDTTEYKRILLQVRSRGSDEDHPYFELEVADVQYLNLMYDGIIKVGWTIGPSCNVTTRNDEAAFDRRFLRWVGRHIGFIYCKAGRVLDDRRPKASPYVTLDPAHRLCLQREEHVVRKFHRAGRHASEETVKSVKNHLKRIGRCYCKVIEPLRGSWDQRIQAIIARSSPCD